MKLGSLKNWARTLGAGMAHVQHGCDKLIEFGLSNIQKAGNDGQEETTSKIGRACKSTFSFIGTLGKSYFETYEDLKAKRK